MHEAFLWSAGPFFTLGLITPEAAKDLRHLRHSWLLKGVKRSNLVVTVAQPNSLIGCDFVKTDCGLLENKQRTV